MCAQQADTMRICRPQDYDEAAEVLDALQNGQMVTLDLSQMARDVRQPAAGFRLRRGVLCRGQYPAHGVVYVSDYPGWRPDRRGCGRSRRAKRKPWRLISAGACCGD